MAVTELGEGLLVRLLDGLVAAVADAAGAGLVLLDGRQSRLVGGVGIAPAYDAGQLACGSGPLIEAADRDEVWVSEHFSLLRYPDLARALPELTDPAPSAVIVIPGAWVDDTRLATTLYLRGPADNDALDMLGWYEPLLANALGLLEYCGEAEAQAEQLLAMVQYRRVIEQAKGIIMSRRSVNPDDAFAELVAASQTSNVRLRTLAIALVETVGGGSAEHPRHPYRAEQSTAAARAAALELWARLNAAGPAASERPRAEPHPATGDRGHQPKDAPPVRGVFREGPTTPPRAPRR